MPPQGAPGGLTVHEERMADILGQLASHPADGSGTLRLCELSAELTGASGASIMLLSDDLVRGSLCTTDGVAAYLDDLQFTLGEGPAHRCPRPGCPSLSPIWHRLGESGGRHSPRSPSVAGVRAVFAFPVRIGAVRMGALTLYRDGPGPLVTRSTPMPC